MNDRQIISLFFERSEKAIAELSGKYGKLLLHIANNILHNSQDAEECVNDSLLIVWETIPPNQPESLMNYAFGTFYDIPLSCGILMICNCFRFAYSYVFAAPPHP